MEVGLQSELNQYYMGWFVTCLLSLFAFRKYFHVGEASTSRPQAVVSSEFTRFQRSYVIVYLIMMGADWLQGPYVYALYKHYGYGIAEIGMLFIVGFGSSMIFGTIVGSMADKYGRKKLCLTFGVLYSLSCLTKHSSDYRMLLLGRFMGGVSTSILFSSFESWMVHEHHLARYPEDWLGLTFSICTSGNGIVAIGSGVVAGVVRDKFGPVAPFDVSLLCLIAGSLLVAFTWNENTGDSTIDLSHTLSNALERLKADPKIIYLGIIQSFFEGAMYIFVFMWTPALEDSSPFVGHHISHGWIFASFMICTLLGSGIFQLAMEKQMKVEKLALQMISVAAVSLLLPAFTDSHILRLLCFFVFEMCVGLFWPSLGFLRSRYVPEEVRATTMNFFRVPLNLIVVLVLANIDKLSHFQVFCLCFLVLLPALYCQKKLCDLSDHAEDAAAKSSASSAGADKEPVPLKELKPSAKGAVGH